jgi:uncharacterized membrane protein
LEINLIDYFIFCNFIILFKLFLKVKKSWDHQTVDETDRKKHILNNSAANNRNQSHEMVKNNSQLSIASSHSAINTNSKSAVLGAGNKIHNPTTKHIL